MTDATQIERQGWTIKEYCQRWPVSPATIYRGIKDGRIKSVKHLGRRIILSEPAPDKSQAA